MAKYTLTYKVVIEADNENMAELISVDLEGDIRHISRAIVDCWCDPYMECEDD